MELLPPSWVCSLIFEIWRAIGNYSAGIRFSRFLIGMIHSIFTAIVVVLG